jgi:RNA recognition motif-containing protein
MNHCARPSDPRRLIGWKAFGAPQGAPADEPPSREIAITMGNRLYVGNLPFSATTGMLRDAFAASGDVTDVHIVTDRESGQSRGFGFVTMGNAHEAANAIAAMNGATLEGRALRVNEAEERPQHGGGGGGGGYGGGGGGGGRGGGGGGRRGKY